MKQYIRLFLALWSVILITGGCGGNDLDYDNPDVKLFVKQLKSGTYKTEGPNGFVCVPDFKMRDIPELLQYVDDFSVIPDFPVPPVTPYLANDLKLGEGMLWAIESVRLGKWASLGCKLVYRDADNYERRFFLTEQELKEVAAAYKTWWQNYSLLIERVVTGDVSLLTDDALFYLTADPLENTNYRWW